MQIYDIGDGYQAYRLSNVLTDKRSWLVLVRQDSDVMRAEIDEDTTEDAFKRKAAELAGVFECGFRTGWNAVASRCLSLAERLRTEDPNI